MKHYDVLIIGCGVTGAATAYHLSKYKLSVGVVEASNDIGCGATKANSAILHAGYDPEPGTLKAELNAIGVEKLFNTANELNVPIKRNGSLVCAVGKEEEEHLSVAMMGDTLGIGVSLTGLILLSGCNVTSVKMALIIAFLWMASPVSSHLISRLEVVTNEHLAEHCELPEDNWEDELC